MSRASGLAAGSDESYTTRPCGPSTVSSQRPNASAMPAAGLVGAAQSVERRRRVNSVSGSSGSRSSMAAVISSVEREPARSGTFAGARRIGQRARCAAQLGVEHRAARALPPSRGPRRRSRTPARPARRARARPRPRASSRSSALSSVNSGPPNSPACWPVTTTRVAGSASGRRPRALRPGRRAGPAGPRGRPPVRRRRRGVDCGGAMVSAQAAGVGWIAGEERLDAREVDTRSRRPGGESRGIVVCQQPTRLAVEVVVVSAGTAAVLSQSVAKRVNSA